MRHTAILCFGLFLLGGCGRMLGVEKDYVLREPITVTFGDWSNERVTIPAGTQVKQTFFKENVAFIAVYGTADRGQLRRSGDELK